MNPLVLPTDDHAPRRLGLDDLAGVKFQLGVECSIVNQDQFGQTAQVKFNIIPVIPSLVGNPIFGGG